MSRAFGILESRTPRQPPLYVSAATPDYHEELAGLVETLVGHGLDYRCELLPSRGSWGRNTNIKAEVIARALIAMGWRRVED